MSDARDDHETLGFSWISTCQKLLFAILASLLPGLSHAETTLVFGTYAADKPTETVRKYAPFLDFLSRELTEQLGEPITIRMNIQKDYDAAIEDLVTGNVDFARFGPASYITAKQSNGDIDIIAVEANKGTKRFKGVIAVHSDSSLTTLSELKGQSFAFGDELSTIGRYLSQSYLVEAGIHASDLSHYAYLGRHDIVGEAVGAGRFTAGALKESTFQKLSAKGVPIRPLMKFDNVTKPWLSASELAPNVAMAISAIMLDPANADIMTKIAKHGFLAGSDDDYELIRRAIMHSQLF
ncbi:MAG: PhnD/SsuA/transferrin family substrate-binding protein [Paracoccaceae bacterium]